MIDFKEDLKTKNRNLTELLLKVSESRDDRLFVSHTFWYDPLIKYYFYLWCSPKIPIVKQ